MVKRIRKKEMDKKRSKKKRKKMDRKKWARIKLGLLYQMTVLTNKKVLLLYTGFLMTATSWVSQFWIMV